MEKLLLHQYSLVFGNKTDFERKEKFSLVFGNKPDFERKILTLY